MRDERDKKERENFKHGLVEMRKTERENILNTDLLEIRETERKKILNTDLLEIRETERKRKILNTDL